MAIDTRSRRASILGMTLASLLFLPLADSTVGQEDRQHVAYCYAGISAVPPVVIAPATPDFYLISGIVRVAGSAYIIGGHSAIYQGEGVWDDDSATWDSDTDVWDYVGVPSPQLPGPIWPATYTFGYITSPYAVNVPVSSWFRELSHTVWGLPPLPIAARMHTVIDPTALLIKWTSEDPFVGLWTAEAGAADTWVEEAGITNIWTLEDEVIC